MDLTTHAPRSSRSLFAGVVGLGRTTDKARAFLNGTLGDYYYGYDCPHDWAVFDVLGIDGAKYATMVARLGDDAAIEAWVQETYLHTIGPERISQWNDEFLRCGPDYAPTLIPDGNPLKGLTNDIFAGFLTAIAPERTDVRTVVGLLDIEDGHEAILR
jgi:hypothetical protein